MVDISIDIDEYLLREVQKVCSGYGITVEQLIVAFIHFCACPDNYEAVKVYFSQCDTM